MQERLAVLDKVFKQLKLKEILQMQNARHHADLSQKDFNKLKKLHRKQVRLIGGIGQSLAGIGTQAADTGRVYGAMAPADLAFIWRWSGRIRGDLGKMLLRWKEKKCKGQLSKHYYHIIMHMVRFWYTFCGVYTTRTTTYLSN